MSPRFNSRPHGDDADEDRHRTSAISVPAARVEAEAGEVADELVDVADGDAVVDDDDDPEGAEFGGDALEEHALEDHGLEDDWPEEDLPVRPDPWADTPATNRVGFVLFLIVNAVLFIRPAELLPALKVVPIYNLAMVGALATSAGPLLAQLRWSALSAHPGTLCVLGLLPAIVLASLAQGDTWRAREGGVEFLKVALFYLLLLGLVNTPARLRSYLLTLVFLLLAVAALALLRYHGVIALDALAALEDRRGGVDEFTGDRISFMRLQASGIFNDPNDFSLIMAAGILIGTQFLLEEKRFLHRLLYFAPVGTFLYALVLTYSRGGFLSLLVGIMVLMVSRFGVRRAIPLAVVVLPVLLVAVGGRQTNMNFGDEGDTGHARVQIWADGLELFKATPLFGIGYGMYGEEVGIVAHNSFVHCYVELGIIGGTLFLGAFYLPLSVMRRRGLANARRTGDETRRWRPYLMAVTIGYMVGLCSLSRSYTVSTYLIVGLAAAYAKLAAVETAEVEEPAPLGGVVVRLAGLSVVCLICMFVFVRLLVH